MRQAVVHFTARVCRFRKGARTVALSWLGGLLVSSLLLSGLAHPSIARAWTRTQIRGAQAHLNVVNESSADVAMSIRLRISGGWLSELELPGVPESITLDPAKPATLVADTGEKYVPELVFRRGVWRVTFANRRSAPWRGEYTLTLLYRQTLEHEGESAPGFQRLRWTMPPWRLGIEDARIWISAPDGARSAETLEPSVAAALHVEHVGERVVIAHQRTQLPRDTAWSVAIDVPGTSQPSATLANRPDAGDNQVSTTTQRVNQPADERISAGLWLPCVVLFLGALKSRATQRLARRRRARPLALIAMAPWLRVVLACGLAFWAGMSWTNQPALAALLLGAITLLAIDRTFEPQAATALHWSVATPAQLSPSVWQRLRSGISLDAWLDVTRPLGALTLASLYALLWQLGKVDSRDATALTLLALLSAPLWTTATRLHLPWEGRRMASLLKRWAQRHLDAVHTCPIESCEPLVCCDDTGLDRDARLPLRATRPIQGVHSLDLSLVTDSRSLRSKVALLAQVVEGSRADRQLHTLPVSSRRTFEHRVIHVVPAEQIVAALQALNAAEATSDVANIEGTNAPDRAAA